MSAPAALTIVVILLLIVFAILLYIESSGRKERLLRQKGERLRANVLAKYGDQGREQFFINVMDHLPSPPEWMEGPLATVIDGIYERECAVTIPDAPIYYNSLEGARYLDALADITGDQDAQARALSGVLQPYLKAYATDGSDFMATPSNPDRIVELMLVSLFTDKKLDATWQQVSLNMLAQDNVIPTKYRGEDVAAAYLQDTPLLKLFRVRVPFAIPDHVWFEHAHIVAPSGAGKTQLLSQLFLKLHEKGAVVAVDSQGDWIGKLRRLKKIQNRVLYIDPRDPPTVNLFKADIMEYLFSVQGSDLTAKQRVFFSFLTRLMREVPNATMMDVLRALHDIKPYMQYVDNLPEVQRLFLEKDYNTSTFSKTKEEVRYRINALLEHPTMERLFTSSEQAIDIGSELNKGTIILIDTSLEYLKGASAPFGKIFIALVLQAIQDRAAIPESERRPAYFLCDEAAAYFDKNITDLLEMARKYKMSCTFAHQQLSQCTPDLRASLMGNTSIKMATQNAVDDAKALAPNMRATADFILAQPKLTFAAYIRGVTENAVAIEVTPGLLEREPMVAPFPVKEPKTERQAPPRRDASGNTEADEVQETPTDDGEADVSAQPTVAAHDAPSACEPEPVRSSTTSPRGAEKRGSVDTPSTDATEGW